MGCPRPDQAVDVLVLGPNWAGVRHNLVPKIILVVQLVDHGLEDDLEEGDHQVEHKPDVHHLDVGGPREGVGDADEERREHE